MLYIPPYWQSLPAKRAAPYKAIWIYLVYIRYRAYTPVEYMYHHTTDYLF